MIGAVTLVLAILATTWSAVSPSTVGPSQASVALFGLEVVAIDCRGRPAPVLKKHAVDSCALRDLLRAGLQAGPVKAIEPGVMGAYSPPTLGFEVSAQEGAESGVVAFSVALVLREPFVRQLTGPIYRVWAITWSTEYLGVVQEKDLADEVRRIAASFVSEFTREAREAPSAFR